MPFVEPMLASPLREDFCLTPGAWVAEEKFDGHRMIVSVAENGGNLFGDPSVCAWSRNAIPRILPPHIRKDLESLPSGIYDGELIVPGGKSFGVTVHEDMDKQVLVLFDVIEVVGRSTVNLSCEERRMALAEIFTHREVEAPVRLAERHELRSMDVVRKLRDEVWARGGEGLILKRLGSVYSVGRRTKDWIKIKELKSAVMQLVGFRQGKMGPRSIVVLRDDEGNVTTVKWKDLETLRDIEANGEKYVRDGRLVRVEYQERTPDGGYRHPRWDRWEDR